MIVAGCYRVHVPRGARCSAGAGALRHALQPHRGGPHLSASVRRAVAGLRQGRPGLPVGAALSAYPAIYRDVLTQDLKGRRHDYVRASLILAPSEFVLQRQESGHHPCAIAALLGGNALIPGPPKG